MVRLIKITTGSICIEDVSTSPTRPWRRRKVRNRKTKWKTYSSRDSHVVTHRSTNLPFNCLCMAERTGCPVFS
ncbi:hypothetical protein M438DRAFT_274682 [Aureobasidium pullulans EXF-150]|uniref:Uncharacterized protein n=1 Tax=Aureobasidium pullulans EXF-150 TaxID=1043002 RepID=A0A074XE82_AURPU|nr:uncharacterized protein M438DRAFT_274682 [Aureobasidium pullulans EXF-150]KEQ83820.1 hypothetical protein M438DRAFT_274682 [Aureobasidium pullulans EXF-150]